jgi:hypothetical protein
LKQDREAIEQQISEELEHEDKADETDKKEIPALVREWDQPKLSKLNYFKSI